ncbi:MAG TPA: GldG family protein, partial [Bryobacteraceae bacterium]|nr:GldG family protein [Bryobacteraceae bacterium]
MARKTMEGSQRQAKYGATAALYVIVVIAILVAINWLANRYNKSYDATANKRYTLSEQTKKIVHELKGDATITYIDRTSQFDQAKSLLERYANLSPKIHINYVDYMKNPTVARSYNLKYPGTAFIEYDKKREEAKAMTEEGITGALIRAEKGGTKKVCFVQGSGEHSLDESGQNGLSRFKDALSKESYDATPINLLQNAQVPKDCTVLVVAGPQYDYQAPEVSAIQNYVQNGGR